MMRSCLLTVTGILVGCYAPSPPTGAPCGDNTECPAGLVCSPATRTCEVTAVEPADAAGGDAAGDAPVLADAPPGSDAPASPFLYRRRISITATAALPAGLTIRVPLGQTLATLVQQSKVRADFADLRIIGDGALGERDRIVDPPNGPAPAAVSFSLAQPIAAGDTSTDYALYYGAPAAAAAPANGSAVFALYDDFGSGVSSVWLANDAPATSNDRLVLRAGQSDALTTNAATDGVPVVSGVEVVARILDPTSDPTPQPEGTFYYWFGYQHTGDFAANDPWIIWIARGKDQVRGEQKSPVGCEAGCSGTDATQSTSMRYYAIERDPGATRFYLDGTLSFTASVTNQADYSVMVRNYMATSDVQIEWIRARARVTPEPPITLAGEESL
jgi:hypothetical protein